MNLSFKDISQEASRARSFGCRSHSSNCMFAVAIKMKETMKNPGVSFMTIDKCKFRKPVTPGDVLNLKVKRLNKVKNVYKFEGQCIVNDVIYAQCIFSAMIHDVPSSS